MILLCLILFPMAAALAVPFLKRRDWLVRLVPALELLAALTLLVRPDMALALPGVCGLGLNLTAGSLRTLLVLVSACLWLGTGLNSPSYFAHDPRRGRFYVFWLLTQGALMGVFLAADLGTLFVFFEMMSFTSYVWVAQNETPEALRAGQTYLAVAVIGGMTLLTGLFLLRQLLGTLTIAALADAAAALGTEQRPMLYAAGGCCLAGFGAKAGMFPLHIWLPKAHPVAPAPASALLSGILTKSGVFGVLIICRMLFPADLGWSGLVLALGLVTMLLGAVLAVFSIDLKRTLACSSMSQIGFILTGAAMQGFLAGENALAAWGTVLHMLNHALIKLVLFLAAGVIYCHTHALDLNRIRGWGRKRPLLKAAFLLGAASIAGVPGFSGYVSKTLLHESIVEYIHLLQHAGESALVFQAAEWVFLISGGLTAAYMTKLFVAIFLEGEGESGPYLDRGTALTLGCGGLTLLVLGLTPNRTMDAIGGWAAEFLRADHMHHAIHYFSWTNLKGALISLAIGAVVYLLVIRRGLMRDGVYLDRWPRQWDLEDRVYRPALAGLAFLGALCARLAASISDVVIWLGKRLLFARAPGVFQPKEAENFGEYGRRPRRFLVGETFAFDLLAAGVGLVAVLAYLLW